LHEDPWLFLGDGNAGQQDDNENSFFHVLPPHEFPMQEVAMKMTMVIEEKAKRRWRCARATVDAST
jgi:hypothetical protein